MGKRSEKMYKTKPHLERKENGKMGVKKAEEVSDGVEGEAHEGGKMHAHVRHGMERRDMNNRHETEHAVHDTGGHEDKKEMHTRHEKERKEMHSRHEKEGSEPKGEKPEKKEPKKEPEVAEKVESNENEEE